MKIRLLLGILDIYQRSNQIDWIICIQNIPKLRYMCQWWIMWRDLFWCIHDQEDLRSVSYDSLGNIQLFFEPKEVYFGQTVEESWENIWVMSWWRAKKMSCQGTHKNKRMCNNLPPILAIILTDSNGSKDIQFLDFDNGWHVSDKDAFFQV